MHIFGLENTQPTGMSPLTEIRETTTNTSNIRKRPAVKESSEEKEVIDDDIRKSFVGKYMYNIVCTMYALIARYLCHDKHHP
jgi:hypothetical protein